MVTNDLPQNEPPTGTQTSSHAEKPEQAAIAAGPSRRKAAGRASSLGPDPGATSVFSMRLIAERAGAATPARHEVREERFEAYAHEGLNE